MTRISRKSLPLCLLAALSVSSLAAAAPPKPKEHGEGRLFSATLVNERPCLVFGKPAAPSLTRSSAADLASRVRAALLGASKPARKRGVVQPPPVEKRWVCGEWTELWQGSGRGRTCEWREVALAPRDVEAEK